MALSQKIRLLNTALPGGLAFSKVNGVKAMSLCHVPYELESIVYDWLTELPVRYRTYESADSIVVLGPEGVALTAHGWEQFVSWMTTTLKAVLAGYRPHIPIAEHDNRLNRGLRGERRLYDQNGNSELIVGEWDNGSAQVEPQSFSDVGIAEAMRSLK